MSAQQHWDERYRNGEHVHDPPLEFLERLIPASLGRPALDLACGAGRHSLLLAQRGWQVTAVDWSAAALEVVKQLDPRINAVQADLEAGGFLIQRNHWHLICVSFFMQRDLFPAISGGLVDGGLLAAAFPMVDEREGVRPMRREFLIEAGELRAAFEGPFEILHDHETEPEPPKRRTAEFLARRRRS